MTTVFKDTEIVSWPDAIKYALDDEIDQLLSDDFLNRVLLVPFLIINNILVEIILVIGVAVLILFKFTDNLVRIHYIIHYLWVKSFINTFLKTDKARIGETEAFKLDYGLAYGLSGGLDGSLAYSLAGGLVFGLWSFSEDLVLGLIFPFIAYFAVSLTKKIRNHVNTQFLNIMLLLYVVIFVKGEYKYPFPIIIIIKIIFYRFNFNKLEKLNQV